MTQDRVLQLRRALAARALVEDGQAESGDQVESAALDATELEDEHEILGRAKAAVSHARKSDGHEAGDDAFEEALRLFEEHSQIVLRKLKRGSAPLSDNEADALEAVIIADGTRPSFLLRDGIPALADPFIGQWRDTVSAFYPAMRDIARGVGRIQPAHGSASRYIGTGSLIDAGKMLVLTNYHVIDDARTRNGVAMTQNGREITVQGVLEIDFDGEATSLGENRFRIVRISLPEGYGPGYSGIDAAVAEIEPIDGASVLPPSVPRLSRDASYANGGMTSLATIGFPGPPPATTGASAGLHGAIDWGFVTRTLFGNKFGFKRLAPGQFTSARGTNPADLKCSAFGYDATTFGGSSGSLVIAWTDIGAPAFGLHFIGDTGTENHALALATTVAQLEAIGVPFV